MGKRIEYNAAYGFIGPNRLTGDFSSGEVSQLIRVQSSEVSFSSPPTPVPQPGSFSVPTTTLEGPYVDLNLNYLSTNGENETAAGFVTDGSLGAFANLGQNERHLFLVENPSHPDDPTTAMGLGHMALVGYEMDAAVNQPIQSKMSFRGYNISIATGVTGHTPLINLSDGIPEQNYTYELPPYNPGTHERVTGNLGNSIVNLASDITLSYPSGASFGLDIGDSSKVFIQSFGLRISLPRTESKKLNDRYPSNRTLNYPIVVNASAELTLKRHEAEHLQSAINKTGDIEFEVRTKSCGMGYDEDWNRSGVTSIKYLLKGARFLSQSESLSIGNAVNLTLDWQVSVGNPSSEINNFLISGNYGELTYVFKEYSSTSGLEIPASYGVSGFDSILYYNKVKKDIDIKDFDMSLSDFPEISSGLYDNGFLNGFLYQGNTGIINDTGIVASGLTRSSSGWNAAYGTADLKSYQMTRYTGVIALYDYGWPSGLITRQNEYPMMISMNGFNDERINMRVEGLPSGISGSFAEPSFTPNPNQSYYFNSLNIKVTDQQFPIANERELMVVAETSTIRKIMSLKMETEEIYHITLLPEHIGQFHTWIDTYDRFSYQMDSGIPYFSFDDQYYHFDYMLDKVSGAKHSIHNEVIGNKAYLLSDSVANKTSVPVRNDQLGYRMITSGILYDENYDNFSVFFLGSCLEREDDVIPYPFWMGQSYLDIGSGFAYGRSGEHAIFQTSGQTTVVSGVFDDNIHLHSLIYDGTGIEIRVDGDSKGNFMHSGDAIGRISGEGMAIYHDAKGRFCELLVGSGLVTGNNLDLIEDYIEYKWHYSWYNTSGYVEINRPNIFEYPDPIPSGQEWICDFSLSGTSYYGQSGIVGFCDGGGFVWP